MIRLDDLTLFVRTAVLGSFSNVAREVDLLPGQVSAAIQRLERELDVRLFARSTRSLRLTAEGDRYLPYAREILDALQEGHEHLHGEVDELSGALQVSAPSDIGRNVLLPWLGDFCAQHPKLSLRLFLSDRVADVFREPIDVAIRYGVAEEASYVALPIAADNRRVVVAAPGYVKRHGRPRALEDLGGHQCLLYAVGGRVYDRWPFFMDGKRRLVTVTGSLFGDDADIAHRLAVQGHGIAYKSWLDVHDDVQAGRLEVLLPEYAGEPAPLNLVCPHRKQFSPAVRELHALLTSKLAPLMANIPAAGSKKKKRPGNRTD